MSLFSLSRTWTVMAATALFCIALPAAGLAATASEPLVLAQADDDPMVEGSVGVQTEPGMEGVDADLRFEFGEEESPPVAAGPDSGGIDVLWVVAGVGVLLIVLLIALLARGEKTVIRE